MDDPVNVTTLPNGTNEQNPRVAGTMRMMHDAFASIAPPVSHSPT